MVHNEMRMAHKNYVNNLLNICDDLISHDTKSNITKRFAKRKDASGIPVLKFDGKEVTDPKEKADILNNQHNSVFTDKNPLLPTLGHSIITDMPNIAIDINGVTKDQPVKGSRCGSDSNACP